MLTILLYNLSSVQDTAKDVKKNAGPTADDLADKAKQGGKQAADKAKSTAGQARKSAHTTLKGTLCGKVAAVNVY